LNDTVDDTKVSVFCIGTEAFSESVIGSVTVTFALEINTTEVFDTGGGTSLMSPDSTLVESVPVAITVTGGLVGGLVVDGKGACVVVVVVG
jgi:hypothetical protein